MEVLNSASTLLTGGLWGKLIELFAKGVGQYAWAIILFTVVLKLVMSPLDVLQRTASQKQQRVTAYMQPELNAINEKYKDDKARINEETQKLYKRYNTGMGGICIKMLISMVVSMVVFFTLFSSIRAIGTEQLYNSYHSLDTAYVQAMEDWNKPDSTINKAEYDDNAQTYAISVTKEEYKKLSERNSWLWVKNVWKEDTKTSQFVDCNSYINWYNGNVKQLSDEEKTVITERYNLITKSIGDEYGVKNGYYVLIIVCALVSFLTQFISAKLLSPKGQKMSMMNKVMFIVMPIAMLFFAWQSNVVFTLYIITNSIMTAVISTILSLIMRKMGKKEVEKLTTARNTGVVEYSRNYKK